MVFPTVYFMALIPNYNSTLFFFFSSRRRHTRSKRDWSSDVCSSDLSANPGPYQPPFTNPGAERTFAGFSPLSPISITQHDIRQPYLMQWNLSLDQQLPGSVGLSVSYVGTRGLHLWGQGDVNPCIPTGIVNGVPYWANTQGPGGTPAACPSVNMLFPSGHVCTVITSTGSTLRFPSGRANCNLREDNAIRTSSRSWYDGLQVNVQKRLSHGLEFQSAYTYSNNLDTTQGRLSIDSEAFTPYVPRNFDKGRSVVNATHNWRFNTLYTFPARQSQGLVSRLVNGWSMQNIVSVQSGYGFTPAAPGDVSLNATTNINSAYERPELVTSANLRDVTTCVGTTGLTPLGRQCNVNAVVYSPAAVITGDPNRWFNPNMFATPIPGYPGNVARGSLAGPGLLNWDFSMHKNTPLAFLGEAGNLQFRAEFFNILNRANFINNPANGNGIVGPNAGRLTAARDGRD